VPKSRAERKKGKEKKEEALDKVRAAPWPQSCSSGLCGSCRVKFTRIRHWHKFPPSLEWVLGFLWPTVMEEAGLSSQLACEATEGLETP
jgi:hypothetical protein